MSTTQVIPPPYKGQNDQFPLISIQNPNCERMENFNNKGGILKLRKGNDKFASGTALFSPLNIAAYPGAFNTGKLFMLLDELGSNYKWYDVTNGTATLVNTVAGSGDDEIHTLYYNGYLYFMGEQDLTPGGSSKVVYYNGSTWGLATGFTWGSITIPFGGNAYKNRGYFIQRQSAMYGYTEIDAVVAGTVTAVNLASIINSSAYLYIIRAIALVEGATQDSVQAFLFSNGQVLIYSGSYPDSASWSLISQFRISALLYNDCYVDAKGDSFIFTETEILSLRNLFVGGYGKERADGIGASIQRRWSQITAALIANSQDNVIFIKGIYDERNDRIVITLPKYVDPVSGTVTAAKPFQLIYDFILGAWYEYYAVTTTVDHIVGGAYVNGDTFILADCGASAAQVIRIDYETTYVDDRLDAAGTVAIPYKVRTAPLPVPKFGANAITGIEAICKSDLYAQTNYALIADLGRQTTTSQALVDQGSSVAKPMINVGIQGASAVQLEISGSSASASIGLELYALNIWYNEGAAGSR